jgi:hypothetical protein
MIASDGTNYFTNRGIGGGGAVNSVSGTAPIASTGGSNPVISLNNGGVTLAKIQNATGSSIVLGSGSSGAGSSYSEITLGSNLSMSGTTLNAAGGSSGSGVTFGQLVNYTTCPQTL